MNDRTEVLNRATNRQISFIESLLDERDLTASHKFVDATQAMDAEELAAYIASIKAGLQDRSTRGASQMIEALLALPKKSSAPAYPARTNADIPEVPKGRYAVENDEGELRFYKVWRGDRNPAYFKLYVQHGPDESEIPFRSALSILQKIVDAGIRAAAIRYGHEIGACSNCGRRLTNRVSRELGIGPVCGGRMFGREFKDEVKAARETIVARGEDPDEEVAE